MAWCSQTTRNCLGQCSPRPLTCYYFVSWEQCVNNTSSPRQDDRHFPDDIFNCIFLNENDRILIQISLTYVPRCPIVNNPALLQAWTNDDDPIYWRIYAALGGNELTHRGRDDMDAITQTTFSSAFFLKKMFEFRLKFHWNLFLGQWWLVCWRIYASLGLNELIGPLWMSSKVPQV